MNPTLAIQFIIDLLSNLPKEEADVQAIVAELKSTDDLATKIKAEITDVQALLSAISAGL